MKCSWKGHKDRDRHKNRIKRSGQARLVFVWHKPQHPHSVKVSPWGRGGGERERRERERVSKLVRTKLRQIGVRKFGTHRESTKWPAADWPYSGERQRQRVRNLILMSCQLSRTTSGRERNKEKETDRQTDRLTQRQSYPQFYVHCKWAFVRNTTFSMTFCSVSFCPVSFCPQHHLLDDLFYSLLLSATPPSRWPFLSSKFLSGELFSGSQVLNP